MCWKKWGAGCEDLARATANLEAAIAAQEARHAVEDGLILLASAVWRRWRAPPGI